MGLEQKEGTGQVVGATLRGRPVGVALRGHPVGTAQSPSPTGPENGRCPHLII